MNIEDKKKITGISTNPVNAANILRLIQSDYIPKSVIEGKIKELEDDFVSIGDSRFKVVHDIEIRTLKKLLNK